jgi:hypothetical protein
VAGHDPVAGKFLLLHAKIMALVFRKPEQLGKRVGIQKPGDSFPGVKLAGFGLLGDSCLSSARQANLFAFSQLGNLFFDLHYDLPILSTKFFPILRIADAQNTHLVPERERTFAFLQKINPPLFRV